MAATVYSMPPFEHLRALFLVDLRLMDPDFFAPE